MRGALCVIGFTLLATAVASRAAGNPGHEIRSTVPLAGSIWLNLNRKKNRIPQLRRRPNPSWPRKSGRWR